MTSTRISVYWPNGWAADFQRAVTFPELQWLSGAQESCDSAKGNLWKFRIMAWLTRVNRGGGQLDLPPTIDWMFSVCSYGARECSDVNASQHSKKSEAETAALVEAESTKPLRPAEAMCARLCARP
jgi:hypothetical protein